MYASAAQAQKEVQERYFEAGVTLFVYRCPWCGKWHLTKSDPNAYKRRNEILFGKKGKGGKKSRAGRI